MAKRFIDTGLFDDPWFMDLSLSEKVLWVYCITKCDHAGILELNEKLCQFQTGIKNIKPIIKGLGNRLIMVSGPYYFIPKYLEYQYPNFPNSKVRQQDSAIKRLKEFKLFDEHTQSVIEGLVNSYDNVSVNGNVSVNETGTIEKVKGKCLMRNSGVKLSDVEDAFKGSDDLMFADAKYYFNSALAWSDSGGNMRIDWIATISNFARRDMRDQKLKIRKKTRQETEKPRGDYGVPSPTAVPMPESIKKRISKIGKG
jgi:hypothetical protein